jgi:CPA2 family monovalent cation:H+ antiporter-2
LLYRLIDPVEAWLKRRSKPKTFHDEEHDVTEGDARHRAVVVGYGPVGQTVTQLLLDNGIEPAVIELNHETVRRLKAFGVKAIYGDASRPEILSEAGIGTAENLILSSSPSGTDEEVVRRAKELHPDIHVLARSQYIREIHRLESAGAAEVFSSEGEVALAMTVRVLERLGATAEQIDRERERIKKTFE